MSSVLGLEDVGSFIKEALFLENTSAKPLVNAIGVIDSSVLEPITPCSNSVVVSQSEMSDSITHFKGDFFRSIPFSSDFCLGVSKSDTIEAPMLKFKTCNFGKYGPDSRVSKESAVIEMCLSSATRFACSLVTRSFILGEKFKRMSNWINASEASECLRISFDNGVLGNFDEAMMFIVWHMGRTKSKQEPLWSRVSDCSELKGVTNDFMRSGWSDIVDEEWKRIDISGGCNIPENPVRDDPNFEIIRGSDFDKLSLTLCVDGSGRSLRVVGDNKESYLSFKSFKKSIGTKRNNITKKEVPTLEFRLRSRWISINDDPIKTIVSLLEGGGFDVSVSDCVYGWVDNVKNRHHIESTPFEQYIERGDEWEEIHSDDGVTSEHKDIYNQCLGVIEDKIDWPLWEYQKIDLARMLCKPSVMYAAFMSAGKSRIAMSYIEARGGKRNLIILQSRLIGEFIDEANKIGFPEEDINVIDSAEDAEYGNLKRLNLLSYSKVWRPIDERTRDKEPGLDSSDVPVETIASTLRQVRFNTLVFDEAHHLKGGLKTKKARYSMLIRAKHVICMSGTLARNHPEDLLPLMVRTFGENTTSSRWALKLPIEHNEDPEICTSGKRVFSSNFVETAYVTSQFGEDSGKKRGRKLPTVPDEKISDWRDMLQPKAIRRKRREPVVVKDRPMPEPDFEEVEFEIDQQHAEFYLWWLESYFDWFEKEMDKSSSGNYNINNGAVLAQLNKLQFASTIPQSDKVEIDDGEDFGISWSGELTSKQSGIIDSVRKSVMHGENVVVFAKRPALLELFEKEFELMSINTVKINGSMSMNKRDKNKKLFKNNEDIPVLLITLGAGNTGYNFPEADTLWLCDYDWVSSTMEQAAARILRSGWLTEERKESGAKPKIRQAVQLGTIDEYMRQLVGFKGEGIGQALDRQEVEFDTDNWLSYKDFSIRMFRELGFSI